MRCDLGGLLNPVKQTLRELAPSVDEGRVRESEQSERSRTRASSPYAQVIDSRTSGRNKIISLENNYTSLEIVELFLRAK
jgi:translation elongation factor EF-1alpha